MAPIPGLVLAVVWIGIVAFLKMASIASLLAMALYVPAAAIQGHTDWALIWSAVIALVVIARHAPNIRRLVAGEERRITREAAG